VVDRANKNPNRGATVEGTRISVAPAVLRLLGSRGRRPGGWSRPARGRREGRDLPWAHPKQGGKPDAQDVTRHSRAHGRRSGHRGVWCGRRVRYPRRSLSKSANAC